MSEINAFDSAVSELMAATHCDRTKAEHLVRQQMPYLVPRGRFDIDDDAIEDEHVDAGDRLMRALGFDVVKFSQKRRSKVTEGVPDRRYYHRARRLFCWWEAKAEWGRQSPAQREFQDMCVECGDPYVLGGIDALRRWLTVYNVAAFDENWNPEPMPYVTT